MGELASLRELELAFNRLDGEIPSEFGRLATLRWLNLAGSKLSGDLPTGLRTLSDLGVLHIADIYFAVDATVPYSAVEELEIDSAELPVLLSQATECRGGLRFPQYSFCIGGGRFILGHDADRRMVVRDLHWQQEPESIEGLFKLLDEGVVPGIIAAPALSVNFSSRDGDLVFEENRSVIFASGRGVRAVVISYAADRELLAAAYQGDVGRIRQLVAREANINTIDSHGQTVLNIAISDSDVEMVRVLVESGADVDFNTPLMTAIDHGNSEIVKILVEAGADVNAKDPWNDHPWGNSLLDSANYSGDSEIIGILITAGAESAWPDREAPPPMADAGALYTSDASGLRDAIVDGDADSVRTLVEAGVNVDAKAAGGESILAAAIIYQNDPEIVRILVDAGADLDAKDNYGIPVLFEAISPHDWGPEAKEILQILVDAGADVNARDDDGRPLLAEAIRPGNILTDYPEIVRVLVDAGANANILDERGVPTIFWALLEPYEAYEGAHDIMRMLIDASADANAQDDRGSPVLFEAVQNGELESVRILVNAGADVNSKDSRGDSILSEARIRNKSEIVGILIDAGAVE